MLPSNTLDVLFLILAILATRSLTLHQAKSAYQEPPTPTARSTAVGRVRITPGGPPLPETPMTASFHNIRQTEGQGPGLDRPPSTPHPGRAVNQDQIFSPAYSVSPALSHDSRAEAGAGGARVQGRTTTRKGSILIVPQITLSTDPADTAANTFANARPSLSTRGGSYSHGRKSVSFSLSSMDEINNLRTRSLSPIIAGNASPSPSDTLTGDDAAGEAGGKGKLKNVARRPPTPFIRGPASPSERADFRFSNGNGNGNDKKDGQAGVGELVLGMSVGIGLGAGLGLGLSQSQSQGEEGDDVKGGEVEGLLTPLATPGGMMWQQLEHSTEKVDTMGVKKEWLMPK